MCIFQKMKFWWGSTVFDTHINQSETNIVIYYILHVWVISITNHVFNSAIGLVLQFYFWTIILYLSALIFEAFSLWIQVNFLFKLSNGNILIVSLFSRIQFLRKLVNWTITWMALFPRPLSVRARVIAEAFLTSASESDFNKALQQAKTCFKSQKNAHLHRIIPMLIMLTYIMCILQ